MPLPCMQINDSSDSGRQCTHIHKLHLSKRQKANSDDVTPNQHPHSSVAVAQSMFLVFIKKQRSVDQSLFAPTPRPLSRLSFTVALLPCILSCTASAQACASQQCLQAIRQSCRHCSHTRPKPNSAVEWPGRGQLIS